MFALWVLFLDYDAPHASLPYICTLDIYYKRRRLSRVIAISVAGDFIILHMFIVHFHCPCSHKGPTSEGFSVKGVNQRLRIVSYNRRIEIRVLTYYMNLYIIHIIIL